MKQNWLYLGFFVVFTLVGLSVRYLDQYSAQYQSCAQQWQSEFEKAKNNKLLQDYYLNALEQNKQTVAGKSCPELTARHKQKLVSDLALNNDSGLRGFSNP